VVDIQGGNQQLRQAREHQVRVLIEIIFRSFERSNFILYEKIIILYSHVCITMIFQTKNHAVIKKNYTF